MLSRICLAEIKSWAVGPNHGRIVRLSIFIVFLALNIPVSLAEQLAEHVLDSKIRSEVIDAVLDAVSRLYVYPQTGEKIVARIRVHESAGDYEQVTSAYHLANALTQDLQSVSHDRHLRVIYGKAPPGSNRDIPPTPEQAAALRASRRKENYGLDRVEKLEGNIGYLEIVEFYEPDDEAKEIVAAAMTLVADTDALIIDLRRNRGGMPAMIALITSYLFDEPTHLNDLYWRRDNRTQQFWTTRDVSGQKFGQQKPVFVLASKSTFSGGEEFSYNLQSLKRAVIVGETTGGGAHPGAMFQVHDEFAVWISTGAAINPITKTNWEGVGVSPDVQVPADEALELARHLAIKPR